MRKLSKAQAKFLDAVIAAGPSGVCSPYAGSRGGVVRLSAWHRTAASLQRRGLIDITRSREVYTARAATRAGAPACCAAERRNMNGGCDNCGDPCF